MERFSLPVIIFSTQLKQQRTTNNYDWDCRVYNIQMRTLL